MNAVIDNIETNFEARLLGEAVSSSFAPVVRLVGVGGAGGNAVSYIHKTRLNLAESLAINSDLQALRSVNADIRLPVGSKITRGYGTGGRPELGAEAIKRSEGEIRHILAGSDVVFIAAGLGGGFGSGGAPEVARIARSLGALTIAVVTTPFPFEGKQRERNSEHGLRALCDTANSVIVVPNERLMGIVSGSSRIRDAFKIADSILCQGVKAVVGLLFSQGMINVDLADLDSVLRPGGRSMIGFGAASGKNRAARAAEETLSSTLLDENSTRGAKGVLLHIAAGEDVTLQEVSEIAQIISERSHPDANLVWGLTLDPRLSDWINVTLVATGLDRQLSNSVLPESVVPSSSPLINDSARVVSLDNLREKPSEKLPRLIPLRAVG